MKHSLKIKITLILSFSMFLLIFLCWTANNVFLPGYYEKEKVNTLKQTYDEVYGIIGDTRFNGDANVISRLEKLENDNNNNIYILDISAKSEMLGIYFLYPISGSLSENEKMSIIKNEKYSRIINALKIYIFGGNPEDSKPETLDSEKEKFDVYKYFDNHVDNNFIDLVGFLDNDNMIFIRSNYSNISESTGISNRFLAFTGIIIVILGSIAMFIFSNSLTKPILRLSKISTEMSELKFETRYTDKRKDEIGILGNSINMLSDRLENTISELKTANNELKNDIAKKDETDRMRREFLSNVSHELKTPIALIQGYAEGLADNVNDDEESRNFYCEVIIDEAQKMNKTVKKLLTLNELEFGNTTPEFERFNIVDLVDSLAQSVDILVQQKKGRLIVNKPDPIYVWADQYMIEEVITNYLSNALNHLEGRNIIDISFMIKHNRLRVSVFNTGKNIPEEDLEHIWDKFYKVDKARTREYGGSGIGLSIVKAIIDLHNGSCGVKNHEAGVEFWFELDC